MTKITAITLLLAFFQLSWAQIKVPKTSPYAKVTQHIGIAEVSVEYYRPSMRGRQIFDSLVPYGKIWRTGANGVTTLSTDYDILIGEGKKLAAGSYALYTIPNEKSWKLIIGDDTKVRAGDFKMEDAVYTFDLPVQKIASLESFTIAFENISFESALLTLAWEESKISLSIKHDFEPISMKSIDQTLNNTRPYFDAARFYLDNDKDLNQALKWVEIATAVKAPFYMTHVKAKILHKLGKCKEAVKVAELSLKDSQTAGNMHYVNENQKLIGACE